MFSAMAEYSGPLKRPSIRPTVIPRSRSSSVRLAPGRITFVHTEVDDAYAGQGLGGKLARAALDDVRARGLAVRPDCPFIKGWIAKHPDYADLVA